MYLNRAEGLLQICGRLEQGNGRKLECHPIDHTTTAPAMSADAKRLPSAEMEIAWVQSLNCPPRGLPSSLICFPSAMFQRRMTVSRPQEMSILPSGWKQRPVTP